MLKYKVLILFVLLTFVTGCAQNVSQAKTSASASASPTTVQLSAVYFPRAGQDPAPVLVGLYGDAKKNIDVAAYGLTHPQIVKALIDAHKRGIQVRVITDRQEVEGKTQKHAINTLLLAGVPVKINTHSGLMHLKLSVIDGQVATTGSYNYTTSASERNDEMMAVSQDQAFVKASQSEFERLWNDDKGFAVAKITGE